MDHERSQRNIRFQAEHHPLAYSGEFESLEQYNLHLMHQKAYTDASKLAIGKSVLDVGCNNGWGTSIVGTRASQVIGIDVSEVSVADAQSRFRGTEFRVYDGAKIPFEDASFDMVIS